MARRAVTLVELLVVMVIITTVLLLGGWAVQAIRKDLQMTASINGIERILYVAQTQADTRNVSFGVLFYVAQNNRQVVTLIKTTRPNHNEDEHWNDFCQQYEPVGESYNMFGKGMRAAQIDCLDWNEDSIANEDYRKVFPPIGDDEYTPGVSHRNFFAIVFDMHGRRHAYRPLIVRSLDLDDDGIGDSVNLHVEDTIGAGEGPLKDVVTDNFGERLEFSSRWGMLIYDEYAFRDLPAKDRREYLLKNSRIIGLSSHGRLIELKGE